MMVDGCEYCLKSYEGNVRAAKCGFPSCLKWVHEPCAETNQVSKTGFWYCKIHISKIPQEQRVVNEEESESEIESVDEEAEELKGNKTEKSKVPIKENQVSDKQSEKFENDKVVDSKESPKLPFTSQLDLNKIKKTFHGSNCSLKKKLKKNKKELISIVPFNNEDYNNPFANFNCESCQGDFTKNKRGVLCINCRNTYHETCLNESELEDKNNFRFVCQFCIQDNIRLERINKRQERGLKILKNKAGDDVNMRKKSDSFISSTAKNIKNEMKLKNCFENSSSSLSSDTTDEDIDDKLLKKYKKLKALIKSRKSKSKKKVDSDFSSESSEDESDDFEMTQSQAMINLLKSNQEDRNRNKFEKLPLVEYVDTKWSIFFDLFSQSRKMFSDSENVLRIQNSIKCKEIIDIGGVNLYDPRAYWQAIKLINKRLNQSFNLLHRETAEIIKLKKLRYESDNKRIIEFINKVVNYNSIVVKYGSRKHETDDRVISHIGNIMPNSMLNGWHKLKSKLENKSSVVCVSHISDYLSKQVAYISSKMQAEELDPWNQDSFPNKTFKRNDFNNKRTYNTFFNDKYFHNASNKSIFCWFHKSNDHSAFKCNQLWEMSGKEVSDLARQNNICTYCGNMKHRDCPAAKSMNCKIENCNFKHHILFCYKRRGKNNIQNAQRENHNIRSSANKNKTSKNGERSGRSLNNSDTNSNHQKDDRNNCINSRGTDESEIEIPNSNMYINNPPKTIRINSNKNKSAADPEPSTSGYHAGNDTTFESFSHTNSEKRTTSCILGILVIKLIDSDEKIPLLLDSGSTVSIIEESLADKLNIKGLWHPLRLNWSSNMSRVDYTSRIIKAKVSAIKPNSKEYEIYFRTVKNLNMHEQPFDADEMKNLYPHLRQMNLSSYSRIYGIIGLDNLWCFDQHKVFKPRKWDPSVPYGVRGPLGDIVMGNLNQLIDIYNYLSENDVHISHNVSTSFSYNSILTDDECLELSRLEKRLLGADYKSIYPEDDEIFEERLVLDKLDKTVKKSDNNINYEAPLLFKDDQVVLPTEKSFKLAYRRLMIAEKNSIKNNKFDECIKQIDNLLNKGYAEVVPKEEINCKDNKTFYIPTFFINPKCKRTRFIWDAASKIDGKSLNDHLLNGPNLYTNYMQIIFQMQEGKYLIKGDLQEMFHQIYVRKEDRNALRFLFRRDPKDNVQVLRMKVLIFGAKSSPTISQYVKNKIALDHFDVHPDAANVIKNSTYVDDVITSTDDLEYGKSLILNIRNILKTGGFNLVKLKGNNDNILDLIRCHLTEDDKQNEKLFSTEKIEKLLGYTVDFESDKLKIALTLEKIPENILNCEKKPNMKQVLQLVMSIFDPLGFAEFLTSKLKLIYHWLNKDNYKWNQIIDEKYFTHWKKCISWLKDLKNLSIPRLYSCNLSNAHVKQLIGFGDAGTEILCTVIYIRLLDENRNQIGYRFVCAKSYTVPLNQSRTIPDLEVDVAAKLAKLMVTVEQFHRIKFDEKIYFTDNAAVKEWITHGAKNPKVYVVNRLNKIKTLSDPSEWRWVPTHLQPADFGTKMTSIPKISYENDWFHPLLFQMPEDNWPTIEANIELVSTHLEEEFEQADVTPSFIHKFSSFDRLMNAVIKAREWRHRIKIIKINKEISQMRIAKRVRTRKSNKILHEKINLLKRKKKTILKTIESLWDHYYEVGSSLIKIAQAESYSYELNCLKNNKKLKMSNPLFKWLPYIDDNGIMRVQSRITNNEINRQKFTLDRINPIIMHREHHLTKLIILKYHQSQAHHNVKTVVANLLQKFFIHKIKSTVNNVIKKSCLICKISKAKPEVPLMGDVPDVRLAMQTNVFTNVIIDLLGPIHVKGTRFVTHKRYILVYSCLTTRALHLEVIENLEAQATLRALQNTFNLRGVPNSIFSDNGTNFVGGNRILQNYHNKWNQDLLEHGIINQPIKWYFSPPRTPHMNGSVERVVGLVKKALKCIQTFMDMKHSLYDDFGLKSVLCEIINIINSRPIEILTGYDGQNTFLTPNFFIMQRQNAQTVPAECKVPKTLTQQWNDIKMISNILWEKWLKFYFPLMMAREKWVDKKRSLQVGDIIITADPSIANSWRLGTIQSIIEGSKDQVRKVTVRLGKNKVIEKNSLKTVKSLKKAYKDESDTIVIRPAISVARINLDPEN